MNKKICPLKDEQPESSDSDMFRTPMGVYPREDEQVLREPDGERGPRKYCKISCYKVVLTKEIVCLRICPQFKPSQIEGGCHVQTHGCIRLNR